MGVTLQEQIKPEIITQLGRGPMTLSELSTAIKRNYYTTRGALYQLMEEGEVARIGYNTRNCKYRIGADDTVRTTMSTVSNNGRKFKIIDVLTMRNPQPAAAIAVLNLPKHVSRMLKLVPRLEAGDAIAVDKALRRIFDQAETDLQALRNAVQIYEDLLNNPKNWNVKTLQRFSLDESWDLDRVDEAYEYFFGPRTDTD